jgi:nicotinate-nucleotide pyrophosphorylase
MKLTLEEVIDLADDHAPMVPAWEAAFAAARAEVARLRRIETAAKAYQAAEAVVQLAALSADSPTDPILLDAVTASHKAQQTLFAVSGNN